MAPAAGTAAAPARTEPTGVTGVTLPVVHARVPLPAARLPSPGAMLAQARWTAQAVRSVLPPPERLLYYGGLGAMAVAGVLEWPVAAAAGVGVWIAGRAQRRAGPAAAR